MSQRYGSNEPPTHGKIVLETSLGALDIELWPQQAPLACRNFVQLCLEDYYNEVVFHRVIKGFIAQTGDPTGTGSGGESVFDKPFKDEFHSRLRFNHPGQVAMATPEGVHDQNGSQFFVTLGPCEWLNQKHTIFGKVTGDTIFNAMKFNEVEVSGEEDEKAAHRPLDPIPKILATKVLLSPFDDIVPRKSRFAIAAERAQELQRRKEKKKRKESKHLRKKDARLVSFGDDEDDEEENIRQESLPHNSSIEQCTKDSAPKKPKTEKKDKKDKKEKKKSHKRVKERSDPEDEKSASSISAAKSTATRTEQPRKGSSQSNSSTTDYSFTSIQNVDEKIVQAEKHSRIVSQKEQIKNLARELSSKMNGGSSSSSSNSNGGGGGGGRNSESKKRPKEEKLSALEERRRKYMKSSASNKGKKKAHQGETLKMLEAFKDKLRETNRSTDTNGSNYSGLEADRPTSKNQEQKYSGGIGENLMEDQGVQGANDNTWMRTELKFRKHIDDRFRLNEQDVEPSDLTIIDSETSRGKKELKALEIDSKTR